MVNRDVGGFKSQKLWANVQFNALLPSISRLNEVFSFLSKLLTNSELVNGNTSFVADVVI